MATPEILCGRELLEKRCANCDIFGWEQVDPVVSPLRRCTGCWKISYCSRECQEEHWRKVHKAHCKFFSGAKRLEGDDLHQKDTCIHCILQKEAGAEVFKQDNPNYICLFNNKTPSGRVLLALHGRYPIPSAWNRDNRVEGIIDLLQRLLLRSKPPNSLSISCIQGMWRKFQRSFLCKIFLSVFRKQHFPKTTNERAIRVSIFQN